MQDDIFSQFIPMETHYKLVFHENEVKWIKFHSLKQCLIHVVGNKEKGESILNELNNSEYEYIRVAHKIW